MAKKAPSKSLSAKRTYSLRRDATVASGTRKIEQVFDLPKGSVSLQLPSGRRARSDKKMGPLLSDFGWK
jgi:hypothetical protein